MPHPKPIEGATFKVMKNERMSSDHIRTNLIVRVRLDSQSQRKARRVQVLPFSQVDKYRRLEVIDGYQCHCSRHEGMFGREFYSDGSADIARICNHIRALLESGILAQYGRQPDLDSDGRPTFRHASRSDD